MTSEGQKQELINNAEGLAAEIKLKADATAEAINKIAVALNQEGGEQAELEASMPENNAELPPLTK